MTPAAAREVPADGPTPWQAMERRVLLSRLRELEQRARQLEGMEAHLRELSQEVVFLSRLSDVAHAIHGAVDFRGLLDVGLRRCFAALCAEKGSLLLHEPQADELVVVKAYGACPVPIEGVRLSVGQGVAGYVALHREPLRVEDIARDGRFAVRDSARYATGSFLCVPVQADGSLVGVLSAADRRDGRPFSEQEFRAAVTLADDLAVALKRVRQVEAWQANQHQLMSKLAHELRNPLDGALRFLNLTLAGEGVTSSFGTSGQVRNEGVTSSFGTSGQVRNEDVTPERRRRYLLATKQGLERLGGIVEGLFGLGQCARRDSEPMQVNDLIRQAVSFQEGKAEQRRVRVVFELADELPPVAGGAGLFQVFTNLVSNALDAMEAGGGTLTLSSCRVDGAVVARVGDTGSGMPSEVLGRLFTPFFTTKPPGRGMGLGLAVCREVLDRLHGRIEVTSTPGHGTVFTVAVPCGGVTSSFGTWPPSAK